MSDALAGYRAAALDLIAPYEALDPDDVYRAVQDVIPQPGERVLDIGAGTGRDAAAWQAAGCHVTAVEPVSALWAHPEIPVIHDTLPKLTKVVETNLTFDVIVLSGVWHHLRPNQRISAIPMLKSLLKSEGRIVISLRHGPTPAGRPGYTINPSVEANNFVNYGFKVLFQRPTQSIQAGNKVSGVTWTWIATQRF